MRITKQAASDRLRKATDREINASLVARDATPDERKRLVRELVRSLETQARTTNELTLILISSSRKT